MSMTTLMRRSACAVIPRYAEGVQLWSLHKAHEAYHRCGYCQHSQTYRESAIRHKHNLQVHATRAMKPPQFIHCRTTVQRAKFCTESSYKDSENLNKQSKSRCLEDLDKDPDKNILLKEIPGDFDAPCQANATEVKEELEFDVLQEAEDMPSSQSIIDVEQELLRYDYEEFEEPSVHDICEELPGQDESDITLVEYKRGATGVFDIEELVETLNKENGKQICVIKVPQDKQYCDYMVIASGRSPRHLLAIGSQIQWLYKQKRGRHDPASVNIEGMKSCEDWLAIDLGNIVVHLFLPETRELYDLETLWTVGEDFESQDRIEESSDPFAVFLDMKNFESEIWHNSSGHNNTSK